jgi:membrane-associated phospholipid phosphatase
MEYRVDADDSFLAIVTKFGDSGLLLPASVFLCAGLFAAGARKTAVVFACAWAACIGATILVKILFMACGERVSSSIHSPSGHTSLAAMFFLSLGLMATGAKNQIFGRAVAAGCVALVTAIAVSRVALGAHTLAETLIGAVIGLASFGAFWGFSWPRSPISIKALLLSLVPLGLGYAVLGVSVHFEGPLERVAHWLARRLGC